MWKLKREVVRGQPLRVGEREIVPEALIWSVRSHEAILGGTGDAVVKGAAWVYAVPRALLDRAPEQTYRVPIINWNARLEAILLAAAVALPIVLNAAVALWRPSRRRANLRGDHV